MMAKRKRRTPAMMATSSKRRPRTSPSPHLCSDLVLEILSRLPNKPLFRFRSVSRSWRSLIDTHLSCRALPRSMVGFFSQSRLSIDFLKTSSSSSSSSDIVSTDLSFVPNHDQYHIEDCTNGLLLLCANCPITTTQPVHLVCNPATKRWAAVPGLVCEKDIVSLIFDPFISPHYKALVVHEHYDNSGINNFSKAAVFSSEDGSWRTLGTIDAICYTEVKKVYLDGKVYIPAPPFELLIVDMNNNSHELIELPESTSDYQCYCFGLLEDEICCGEITEDGELAIWVLVKLSQDEHGHGHGWVKKYSKRMRKLEDPLVYGFHPKLDVVFLESGKRVLAFCLGKNEWWDYQGELESEGVSYWGTFPYLPCLVDALAESPRPSAAITGECPAKEFGFD